MVVYSRPTDIEAFEKVYQDEHVPRAVEKLASPRGSHLLPYRRDSLPVD